MKMSTFYLTTPIYYVNARPHLGHAYTTIAADTVVRYRRLAGDDTRFLTGTDEHGDNIARAAAAAGVSPQAYADEISTTFRDMWRSLGISNDDFIRTTEPRHKKIVQEILQKLWDAGEIYLGTYGGHYCFGCERFYTEKEIVDGKCPDHLRPLEWIEEQNYFFRMSKYQEWLIGYIRDHPELIKPERYRNEILGFLRDPLQDLSISRPRARLEWGIPLPFDDTYVTYVWFDALINYVSALGDLDSEATRHYWPHVRHMIGKDIVKPHAIYWPCMLKAANLDIFRELRVTGYWTIEGQKMSKSLGNVVEPPTYTAKYGNDAFRYFLLREMVFGLDADFSDASFRTRFNADLANDLGNLVSRATTLIVNLADGKVPRPDAAARPDDVTVLKEAFERARTEADHALNDYAFHRALAAIWDFVGAANRFVDTTQPWALARQPERRAELGSVLYALAEAVRLLGILLAPFLPDAARRIREGMGQRGEPKLGDAEWGVLATATPIVKIAGLFPRIEEKKAVAVATVAPAAAEAAAVTIDDFRKTELRVAEVVAAEAMPKSRKLLKLTVSLGDEQRTIIAGIAEHYAAADLVGKKVVVVANLQPAKLMGVESQGMLLAASAGTTLAVLTPDRELPPGAKVS